MACDIHAYAEVRSNSGTWLTAINHTPFDDICDYGIFGFLADVRNYSHSPIIVEPRGLPDDLSAGLREHVDQWGPDGHSHSWLTLAELLAYDYEQTIWDRRITKGRNGAALAEEGEGRHLPLREFLGEHYFAELDRLAGLGDPQDVRIVFWFDN